MQALLRRPVRLSSFLFRSELPEVDRLPVDLDLGLPLPVALGPADAEESGGAATARECLILSVARAGGESQVHQAVVVSHVVHMVDLDRGPLAVGDEPGETVGLVILPHESDHSVSVVVPAPSDVPSPSSLDPRQDSALGVVVQSLTGDLGRHIGHGRDRTILAIVK